MTENSTGKIFDIKKYAIHDGPGIRTTVFFQGCPLDCWWCHNPEGKNLDGRIESAGSGKTGQPISRDVDVESVMAEIEKDIIFYDQSGGGVTMSGGEPLMQIDFLKSLLKTCKNINIHTALDTCGYAQYEDFKRISGLVDLYLYDVKAIDDDLHKEYTGVSNETILDNFTKLCHNGNNIVVRIPLIPDITDTDENLEAIADFIKDLNGIDSVSFLPYNRLVESKFSKFGTRDRIGHLETQSKVILKKKSEIFTALGYKVKIGG